MLNKYKEEQPNVCKLLTNSIDTGRYSHAYLFVVNGYDNAYNFIYSFIKSICCNDPKSCDACNICKLIDENAFSDFKVIHTDSMIMKKEMILELQDYFDTKKLYAKKRVYLIKNCERMNVAASNTLLKFLEEPEDDIVAILTTDNINQVIDTIKSRCQVIYFNGSKKSDLKELYTQICPIEHAYEEYLEDIRKVIDFSLLTEKNGLSAIAFTKTKWHDYFVDRIFFKYALNIMLYIYIDVINEKLGQAVIYFGDYISDIKLIATYHDLMYYIKKTKVIMKYIDLIKYNLNLNLCLDKMIIEWEGDVNE